MSYEKKTNSFNISNTSNTSNTSSTSNTYNSSNSNEDLLKQFPKIKFSYESKPYKKVSQNNKSHYETHDSNNYSNKEIYFVIPKGKKYFAWFTNNECFFLELDAQRKIVTITKKNVSHAFPNNTILYGTHFYIRKMKNNRESCDTTYYFTIENIHYYNGLHLDTTSVFEKLKITNDFFKQQLNSQKQHNAVEIGLPHISSSLKGASDIKPFYSAFCIQKRNCNNASNEYENVFYFNSVTTHSSSTPAFIPAPAPAPAPAIAFTTNKINNGNNNKNNNNNGKYKFFMVKADIQNDIYHLSNLDENTNPNVDNELIASIPDYKTSVMMNSLFRNIKENKSLDALEESDDEDEFENVNLDKFVDLSKKIKMKCVYNYKFKKWTPIARE